MGDSLSHLDDLLMQINDSELLVALEIASLT